MNRNTIKSVRSPNWPKLQRLFVQIIETFSTEIMARNFFEFWVSGRRDMKLSIGGRR
jgi:lambda repressor-like predicted transcriptional regulator